MSIDAPSQDAQEEDIKQEERLLVAEEAAKFVSVNGDVSQERIMSIIEASNNGGHAMHGVKWRSCVNIVESQGISPLTPEGGFVSFWTSGSRIFGAISGEGKKVDSYDCPFFNYAHCRENPEIYGSPFLRQSIKDEEVCMAITNNDLIERVVGVKTVVSPDGYLEFKFQVPREALCLLRVRFVRNEKKTPSRAQGILKERALLQLMEEALLKGYKGGETKFIEVYEG